MQVSCMQVLYIYRRLTSTLRLLYTKFPVHYEPSAKMVPVSLARNGLPRFILRLEFSKASVSNNMTTIRFDLLDFGESRDRKYSDYKTHITDLINGSLGTGFRVVYTLSLV